MELERFLGCAFSAQAQVAGARALGRSEDRPREQPTRSASRASASVLDFETLERSGHSPRGALTGDKLEPIALERMHKHSIFTSALLTATQAACATCMYMHRFSLLVELIVTIFDYPLPSVLNREACRRYRNLQMPFPKCISSIIVMKASVYIFKLLVDAEWLNTVQSVITATKLLDKSVLTLSQWRCPSHLTQCPACTHDRNLSRRRLSLLRGASSVRADRHHRHHTAPVVQHRRVRGLVLLRHVHV